MFWSRKRDSKRNDDGAAAPLAEAEPPAPRDTPSTNAKTGYRPVNLPPVEIDVERRADGTLILRNKVQLPDFDSRFMAHVRGTAAAQPDKILYAERDPASDEWRSVTFAQGWRDIKGVAQWLINNGAGQDGPAMIITGNSVAHAIFRLGCMLAGAPVCPVSANYALMGGDFGRLRHVDQLVGPKFILAEGGAELSPALDAIGSGDRMIVSRKPGELGHGAISYDDVIATEPDDALLDQKIEQCNPDERAVYMLTSGSTGMPKAVIQTQRMLTANMFQAFAILGEAAGWRDVMLDWLPWSHVSGAFNMTAAAALGGSLYIDDGKPMPGLFEKTIRNLREISVPYFANVPIGYAMLVEALERDEQLRKTFFKDLRMLLYGGAGLPQDLYERLQNLAEAETGYRIFFTSGYGATETASGCMAIYWDTRDVGIGLPLPGLETKLVPAGDRYEVRMRGPNVTPGYLKAPEKTAESFDDEGFYKLGDAARFHDDDDVTQGLAFAGRLAEEFKMGTGTWVSGGDVRARLIAALAPAVSDLILCGQGRDALAALGNPNLAGLAKISGETDASPADLAGHPAVRAFLTEHLEAYNAANPGKSVRIDRFAFIREPLAPNKHEVSDKGTINQAIASANRDDEIAELYADPAPQHVIVAAK